MIRGVFLTRVKQGLSGLFNFFNQMCYTLSMGILAQNRKKIFFCLIGVICIVSAVYALIVFSHGVGAEVDEVGAIARVQKLAEVQSFTETLRAAGKEPQFLAQDEDDYWFVQVFEVVSEEGGVGHTATFGWYRVEKKGGEVTKEL